MSDPLEDLEAEYEGSVIESENQDQLGDPPDAPPEDPSTDNDPPGFKSYEEWIAEGKDPERYKGKKAYEDEYNRIQEVKGLKDEVKTLSNTLKTTVDAIHDRETKAEERHRKELEAALAQAKEEGDTDKALDTMEQLNDLKAQKKPEASQIHPAIQDFIGKNPALNDSELHQEFARIYNGRLKADGVGQYDELSEVAIRAYAKNAMEGVKSLYPERFKSPRADRQTPKTPKPKPGATVIDPNQAIKDVKVENAYSPQNKDAASEIYELIKAKDPKQAEQFAKRVLEAQ